MIIHKNVCDNCSNEEIIDENAISFAIKFATLTTQKAVETNYYTAQVEKSFCSRGCLCAWFEHNLKMHGELIDESI